MIASLLKPLIQRDQISHFTLAMITKRKKKRNILSRLTSNNVSTTDIILLENPKYRNTVSTGDLPGINKRSTIQEARSLQLSSSATKFQVAG